MSIPDGSGAQRNSNSNGDSRSFKEVVILGNSIPKLLRTNAGSQVDSQKCSHFDSMEIFLKVIMKCGPDNKWAVQWAGVMDKPNGDPVLIQNNDPVDPKPANIGPSVTIKPNNSNLAAKPISFAKPNTKNHARKPVTKPNPPKPALKFIWRPRSGSQSTVVGEASGTRDPEHVSVHSKDSESHLFDSQLSNSQLSNLSLVPIS